MKTKLYDTKGKQAKEIQIPEFFTAEIREDIVAKVLEAKKSMQPYAPSSVAGKQHSASGKVIHRRHVWRSGYGRGMSRIPRKIMTRKGTQANWVGAEVASTRGGRRAHPPKVISMINTKTINKKEMRLALISALSATANRKYVEMKYEKLEGKHLGEIPFIVESKFVSLKAKDLLSAIKNILGKEIFEVGIRKKKVRSGKGTSRGRKYKSNAGLLFVTGSKEKLRTNAFETVTANSVGVSDLAKGGLGRITIYTENAISEIQNKLSGKRTGGKKE